jgi:hypothetical protein
MKDMVNFTIALYNGPAKTAASNSNAPRTIVRLLRMNTVALVRYFVTFDAISRISITAGMNSVLMDEVISLKLLFL